GGYMMTMLKVLTVLVVVYYSFRGARKGAERFFPVLFVLAGAIAIHCISSGPAGLVRLATGMIAGFLCAYVPYRRGSIDLAELAVSAAVGAFAGPAGTTLIFMIVYALTLIESIFHAEITRTRERYTGYLVEAGMLGSGPGDVEGRERDGSADAIGLESMTFPWNSKVTLATLAIVFSGLIL
ncbi:MAG TPA: hypothetical protein VLA34_10990, partial [Candidatus Krumholzibacterium sp.]|nr:hypothetical protein [Candidatus Krumholzibacterium sp.]